MRKNLKSDTNKVNVVVKQILPPEPPKNRFEKNIGLIQFVLVVITFLTLLASVYFSNKSLKISSDQLMQADKQLKLAKDQFDESLKQRAIDKMDARKNDSVQEGRFKIQNKINEKSLQAFELQAGIAK